MGESRFTFDGKAASELDNAEFLVHKGVKVKGSLESSTVKVVSAPSNGTATVKEDGTIDYKPNAQFAGEDSFTYTVRESSGMESEETSVSIVVNDTIADPAPVVEEPKKKSSSGSLAWLTLLAAPFAFMRRRKQK